MSDDDTPDSITLQWTDETGTRRRLAFEPQNTSGWVRTERVQTDDGYWRTDDTESVSEVRLAVGDETLDEPELSDRQIQCVHNWARLDQNATVARWECRDCRMRTETPRGEEP